MKISVVVPVLDEARCLAAALQRLQQARLRGHEVIVVDGGSTDGSPEIAHPLVDRLVRTGRGRALQMNTGAGMATGDWLLFLHADTLIMHDFDSLLPVLPDSTAWGYFHVCLSGRQILLRLVETAMNLRSRITGIATGDQCLFVKRKLFERCGGFAAIALMEDIEICRRLRQTGPPGFINQPVVTSSRRWEQNGIISTILKMWWLRLNWSLGRDPAIIARQYD